MKYRRFRLINFWNIPVHHDFLRQLSACVRLALQRYAFIKIALVLGGVVAQW